MNRTHTHTHNKQITYIHTYNQSRQWDWKKKKRKIERTSPTTKKSWPFLSFFLYCRKWWWNEWNTHTNMQFDMTNKTQNNGPLLHTQTHTHIKHYFFFLIEFKFQQTRKIYMMMMMMIILSRILLWMIPNQQRQWQKKKKTFDKRFSFSQANVFIIIFGFFSSSLFANKKWCIAMQIDDI